MSLKVKWDPKWNYSPCSRWGFDNSTHRRAWSKVWEGNVEKSTRLKVDSTSKSPMYCFTSDVDLDTLYWLELAAPLFRSFSHLGSSALCESVSYLYHWFVSCYSSWAKMIGVVSGALVFPMFTSHFQCLVPLQDMTFWSFFTVRRRASNATGRLLLVKDTVCYRRLAKSVTKVPPGLAGSGWVWIHLDEIFCWMIFTSKFLRYIDIMAGKCWAYPNRA